MPIEAIVVGDTVGEAGARITSFKVTAPRFLLAEINTHRMIARSAASSRAIPVKRRIKMVRQDPFIPSVFGKNQKGMQSGEALDDDMTALARASWKSGCKFAITVAEELSELGLHKEHANRVLEPYCFVDVVMTATEWENFFNLRLSPFAQPEFRIVAQCIDQAMKSSTPIRDRYHLPFVSMEMRSQFESAAQLMNISSARCARVSYKTFDGNESTWKFDSKLAKELAENMHLSPFDHPGIADTITMIGGQYHWARPKHQRQFWGWMPYRVSIESKLGLELSRDSYDPIPKELVDLGLTS